MAISKDPKKTVLHPTTAPAAAARSDKPKGQSADAKAQKSDFDNFDAMKITILSGESLREDIALAEEKRAEEFQNLTQQLAKDTALLSADDIEKMGTLTLADMLRIDPNDERAQSMRTGIVTDYEDGRKYYVVGKDLERYEARRAAESYLRTPSDSSSGKIPTHFEVRTAGNIQADLVASINRAAKITGVPPAMLGAMAGIESGFNAPNMQKSPTGAIGVVQQTGGYRDTVWAKYGNIVSQHVPEAREAMKDGLTREEKIKLAFNEDSAFIIVGLRAKELEKKYGLDLNTPKGMAMVYLEHNSGEGSVKRLLNGQMTDATIRGYNPAIYKGNDTPAEVFAAVERKMVAYGNTYEKIASKIDGTAYAAAKAGSEATVAIAKASASSAAELKSGAIGSITNAAPKDDSNMDARDRKLAQSGPAPVLS